MGKQWTALSQRNVSTLPAAGALIDDAKRWAEIDFKKAQRDVRRLQMRIAKAVMERKWNKAKALQTILSRSFYAKVLAVKRVTTNRGRKTPGIDGVLWQGTRAKWQAVFSLRRRGYRPQPLRRVYIPKKDGIRKRPLSIPTILDRAMQALHKLALAPVAETTADLNSYGFRECRSCADAIAAAFNALSKPNSATWVLEADIRGCYDNISHHWMLNNIPMDRTILQKWLQAGYIDDDRLYPTRKGAPQGGVISPTLANMTLDGLERVVRDAVPRRSRVNFVRYADDFIVTGKSKRLLKTRVKPAIEAFLAERGLSLSEEKTAITYIKHGFTFLGQSFRKHGKKLHVTPSVEGVRLLKCRVIKLIRKHVGAPMEGLVKKLNQTLRGWGYYHRHVVSSEAFSLIDMVVFEQLWRMIRKRHRNKTARWLIRRYWSHTKKRKWIFTVKYKDKKSKSLRIYQVIRLSMLGIKRYIKIKADANPYDPKYVSYLALRRNRKESRLLPALSAREYRALATA